MARHGLTRVAFKGDRAIVVAGPIPPTVAVQGLTEEVTSVTAVDSPLTRRHIQKQANKPPLFIAGATPQAEPAAPVQEEK